MLHAHLDDGCVGRLLLQLQCIRQYLALQHNVRYVLDVNLLGFGGAVYHVADHFFLMSILCARNEWDNSVIMSN